MLNNYNSLQSVPSYTFKGILAAPKGCLAIYDHESFVQIAEGLILISKFTFNDDELPHTVSFPVYNT